MRRRGEEGDQCCIDWEETGGDGEREETSAVLIEDRDIKSPLYACMLGFCRTLEIITRTLREMVNRVRLCGHHNSFEVFTR